MNQAGSPAEPIDSKEAQRIQRATELLQAAESGVRVLRALAWKPEVKATFFARGARELPVVDYAPFDATAVHARLAEARQLFGAATPVDTWLERTATAIGTAADLLAAAGTPRFLEESKKLYGEPGAGAANATPLDLARSFERLCDEVAGLDLGAPPPACHLAEYVARRMSEACQERFGAEAPEVLVVDSLSANALAGPRWIQVRRGACFTDRDVEQLIEHEAFVHVCTSLNGKHQTHLPILGSSHPGTTRTQEGLAVFSEYISGHMDPDRLRRLADRVLAIQAAIEGADFLEVYRFFLERMGEPDQAFENTRRVFRGGVLTGGAPFTKDCVYLDGLLRVTNCLRSIATMGRLDCLQLLFCGKLDLEDLPALAQLAHAGLCAPPKFLPPWVDYRRFLVTYLTYSSFLDRIRAEDHVAHYREMLAEAPALPGSGTWPSAPIRQVR